MSTYWSESFYRATIRQSIDSTQTVPFTLKVSKIPTLTTWLLTLSPNTANEEILEYNGVDGTALTITVVKMGISPSTQTLTVDGTDYNNVTYKKAHSQNDSIRGDVNHLHIIQDNAQKLDIVGGLRTWFWANSTVIVNAAGNEEVKAVSSVSVPTAWDIVRLKKSDNTYEDISYNNMKTDIASVSSPSIQETQFELIIAQWDVVWQLPDWIYKVQQEVKTSTAYGTSTYKDHCKISTWKYAYVYELAGNLYIVVVSISSSDVVTYGTPVLIAAAATPTAKVALIDTDKLIIVYAANASINAISVVATISGTVPTLWAWLSEAQAWNVVIMAVCKVRTGAYAYCFWVGINPSGIKVNTVSGTTITAGTVLATFAFWFTQNTVYCSYLSDNLISFSEWITSGSSITNVKIYAITWWGTTVATTYTGTIASQQWTNYHARYSDTEVIITNSATTERSIFTIPWAWTTLVKTTLTANAAANYPTIPLFTNIYWIHNGASILVYQWDILIWTIASAPAYNTQSIQYDNWRLLFFNGATAIPSIVNLAKVFAIWLAFNNSGLFTPWKLSATKTWILKWYRYYVQPTGSISNWIWVTNTVSMTQFYWRWVLTDTIITEL